MPSGTMANQLALRVLSRPGTEVLCRGALPRVPLRGTRRRPRNAGVQLRAAPRRRRSVLARRRRARARRAGRTTSRRLARDDREHAHAGERAPWRAAELDAVRRRVARAAGVPVHCDGARIWNAAVALGDVAGGARRHRPTRSCSACRRGWRAPVGSLLCGPADVIDDGARGAGRLGGGMRQAGVIAAAGIVALETMVERLADDHRRARRLAEALADRFPGSVDPATVRTNIVCAPLRAFPPDCRGAPRRTTACAAGTIDPRTVRFVTHKDVDDATRSSARSARCARSHTRGADAMGRVLITGCSTGFGRADRGRAHEAGP